MKHRHHFAQGSVLVLVILLATACSPDSFPLSKPGPYHVGKQSIVFEDTSRGDRQVRVTVWYPALPLEGTTSDTLQVGVDLDPDLSGAPYPLLLSSTTMAETLAPYLVSHGFTWASVDGIQTYMAMYEGAIDQPLDILFALDQVAAHPPEGLEGMIDAENAGSIGYSFDGFNSLAMSGARVDPEYYLAQCPTPDATTEAIVGGLSSFNCVPASQWDSFTAHVGESITASEDGLWQPLTDERIRAVMPMAGEGWWLFGERGLAAVDRPVLILVATDDELYKENVLIYEHLGTSDRRLISFIGRTHGEMLQESNIEGMAHFATAFFGYHLQGLEDLARYFSEDFVSKYDDLAWGAYTSK